MLDRTDTEPRHGRKLRLLAAACLDTAQMVDPKVTSRVEAAVEELVPPRGQNETRSLALAGGRVLRRLPSTLNGLSDASAAASVKTAALVGGPEALRLLARWASDPRNAVQRALAQVWRYFDPADYAKTVLRDAPLDKGTITVGLVEHIPHLRTLRHLQNVLLIQSDSGTVDDLAFLRNAPPTTTRLEVAVAGPVDLSPLGNCPALEHVNVFGARASAGLETLATLPKLKKLYIFPPDGGQDLSFMAACPSLTTVALNDCSELSDLSSLVSASRLRNLYLLNTKRLGDLNALTELPDLIEFLIQGAPLARGLAAMTPVLNRLKGLYVWSVATVTSLDALAGGTLDYLSLANCPITDLGPLGTLQSLTHVDLKQLPKVRLAPLVSLPQLRLLTLTDMNELVDLSPLAQTSHRLRVELRNTATVGEPGPLIQVRRR